MVGQASIPVSFIVAKKFNEGTQYDYDFGCRVLIVNTMVNFKEDIILNSFAAFNSPCHPFTVNTPITSCLILKYFPQFFFLVTNTRPSSIPLNFFPVLTLNSVLPYKAPQRCLVSEKVSHIENLEKDREEKASGRNHDVGSISEPASYYRCYCSSQIRQGLGICS